MTCPSPQQNLDFALELGRMVSRNLKEIDQRVTTTCVGMAQGRISPKAGLELIEYYAPGCIGAVFHAAFEGVSPEQLRGAQ
jgi:hypothetical protein